MLLTELTNLELEFSQVGRKDCFSGHEYDVNEPLGACLLDWAQTGLMMNFDHDHADVVDNDDHDVDDDEQEEEGDSGYHWVDGTPIDYLNWAEGEPNSADGN